MPAGGELLGVGAIKQLEPDHAGLKSMHTAVAARRRGVGRAMVDHLVAVAATRGARHYTATANNTFMTLFLG